MNREVLRFERRKREVAVELRNGDYWQNHAACVGEDPEDYTPKSRHEPKHRYNERMQWAGELCARCPVKDQCLINSYELKDFNNFAAGYTGEQRLDKYRKEQVAAARQCSTTQLDQAFEAIADWSGSREPLQDAIIEAVNTQTTLEEVGRFPV